MNVIAFQGKQQLRCLVSFVDAVDLQTIFEFATVRLNSFANLFASSLESATNVLRECRPGGFSKTDERSSFPKS